MEVNLHDFGIDLRVGYDFSLPDSVLPKQLITGVIREPNGHRRCRLQYMEAINHGTYGRIQRVLRDSEECVCKRPMHDGDNFVPEAIVQHIAHTVLINMGIHGAVPRVLDIYMYIAERRFTMEYIRGRSALEEIYVSTDPDTTTLKILAQLCILLGVLESKVHLDHRDLKMTNLWIRPTPVYYRIEIEGAIYTVSAPFQVVILDFGFACIGNAKRQAVVNLGDVIPDVDPCPKDGRDLYQCIMSLWSVNKVRRRLCPTLYNTIQSWVSEVPGGDPHITESSESLNWTYMITGHPRFSFTGLKPLHFIRTLAAFGVHIASYEV